MGAGSAILAHDNKFNRWVAGSGNHYFKDEEECDQQLGELLEDQEQLRNMKTASTSRHQEHFTWKKVLAEYEKLLINNLSA